jgi:hypothetical protein
MILSESAIKIINESEDRISSMAVAYWLYNQYGHINENILNELIDSKVYFVEEIAKVKYIMEELAANNTAGVEVKNPDAIPQRKKKTVKDLLVRRLGK